MLLAEYLASRRYHDELHCIPPVRVASRPQEGPNGVHMQIDKLRRIFQWLANIHSPYFYC